MADRPSALLTNSQRDYIGGDSDHENGTNKRKMRSRIRKRVYTGIEQDGIVLGKMEPELRRDIFQEWESRNYESAPGVDIPKPDAPGDVRFEKHHFRTGVKGLLQFLYFGVEDPRVDVGDFGNILEDAIDAAVREQGQYVENFHLDIELGDLATEEDVRKKLLSGELEFEDLTVKEVRALLGSGEMDPEEFPVGFLANLNDTLENLGVEPVDVSDEKDE